MSVIYPILFSTFDLAGIFYNGRMLLSFAESKTKCQFLQRCSSLFKFQFVLQVAILAFTSIEAWKGLAVQLPCGNLRLLSMTGIEIFLVFSSISFLVIAPDHINRHLCAKLLLSAALCSGFIHSSIILWRSCLLQELTHPLWILFSVVLIEFLLLLPVTSMKYTQQHNQTTGKLRESVFWKMLRENVEAVNLAVWFLMCSGVVTVLEILMALYSIADLKQDLFYQHLFMLNCTAGIGLPLAFSNFVKTDCQCEQVNQETLKTVAVNIDLGRALRDSSSATGRT